MKIYIANTTEKHHDLLFRLPEGNRIIARTIPVGQQIIAHDGSQAEVDSIISQHARYGLVSADSVSKTKNFIGLCYSIDKPVTVNRIEQAMVHNRKVAEETSKENRKILAAAIDENLSQSAGEQGSALQGLQMEVEEVAPKGSDSDKPVMKETIDTVRQGRKSMRGEARAN